MLAPLQLIPEYRTYVWGGHRLRPGLEQTAEAWVIYEKNRIAAGSFAGMTLSSVAETFGAELLGARAVAQTGTRFPLLVKLLDCADWLSLQVHPNDEQAVRLEGPGFFGKTEAWYVLEADPGAQILCGLQPGMDPGELERAVRSGLIVELVQPIAVDAGDTVFIRPGTIHALGPGLLIYEVQQTSDLTYRVFDWNRPATKGRKLHIEQSLEVLDRNAAGKALRPTKTAGEQRVKLVSCDYFTLEQIFLQKDGVALDTCNKTFHALTVLEGQVQLEWSEGKMTLDRFESVVVPAALGSYRLSLASPAKLKEVKLLDEAKLLKVSVEDLNSLPYSLK